MDKLTIGTTSAFGDTPAENLPGTGKDLGATGGVLETDLIIGNPCGLPLVPLRGSRKSTGMISRKSTGTVCFARGQTWAVLACPPTGMLRECSLAAAVPEATGIYDGEELPAKLGFHLLVELDGDDTGWEGFVQQSPKTFANTSGINDDILWAPTFDQ